ncbi:hypothetical protein GCM10027051_05290 [Niabella terrae]
MEKQELRAKTVRDLLANNDLNPGLRKLLDCVADSRELSLFKEAIDLTDWQEAHPESREALLERARQLLEKTSRIPVKEAETRQPVLIAQDICKQYRGGGFSLGPVSLEIRKGQVYGLVGENGNGKTTLLRLLAGSIQYDSGSLSYRLTRPAPDSFSLRTRLVYIPQRTRKWYGSLKDNLKLVPASYGLPAAENETRVLFMIARMGLWKFRHMKWSELSSGYKMRFELARTLLRQPELLLLDEPLANLDVLAQQMILEDLRSIAGSVSQPIAMMLSSQQLYEVEKVSDKVIYLRDGKYTDRDLNKAAGPVSALVVELDTDARREQLAIALQSLGPVNITYNGGVYILYFDAVHTFDQVMRVLGEARLPVTYLRDITHSTRKYFVR